MNNPLVSICIISYNSEKTIIETLESIKKQTYEMIELIISDDCSTDNTICVVQEWLNENSSRFISVKFLTALSNQGIAINLKKAVDVSTGTWIKVLAGDDLLRDDCIQVYIKNVKKYPRVQFFTCRVKVFSSDNISDLSKIQFFYDYLNYLQHSSKSEKKRLSSYKMIYPGPEWFFSRELYNSVGGIDINYSMLDEAPFSFAVVQADNEIVPIDERIVLYRVTQSSASRTGISSFRRLYMQQEYKFFLERQLPVLKEKRMFLELFDVKVLHFLLTKLIDKLDKKGVYDSNIIGWYKVLSPLEFFDWINKQVFRIKWKPL